VPADAYSGRESVDHMRAAWMKAMDEVHAMHGLLCAGRFEAAETMRLSVMAGLEAALDHMTAFYRQLPAPPK
jgi:hypothetical protein